LIPGCIARTLATELRRGAALRFKTATALVALLLTAAVFGVACGGEEGQALPAETPTATPTEDFAWTLSLDGLVESPLNLTLDDLRAMERTTEYVELYCVDYPTIAVEKGNWTGVRLSLLLEQAGVSQQAVKIAFYADDDYSTDLTLTTAMREDVIVAYERDGVPLDENLRLVLPGKWGYKWISRLTRIELVDYDYTGLWESRGYSDEADITDDPAGAE
jgi:DMSO/TMAO reductase YedYZ molybdopterin-dependent catalytic subunit